MSWDEETIEQLKALYAEGLSFSQIARALGNGLTRNACLGKASRLGLPMRGQGTQPRARSTPRINALPSAPKPPKPLPAQALGDFADPEHACTLLELKGTSCRWPIGDPTSEDFRFCGRKKKPGEQPYCDGHHVRAFQPKQPRARFR